MKTGTDTTESQIGDRLARRTPNIWKYAGECDPSPKRKATGARSMQPHMNTSAHVRQPPLHLSNPR